MPETILENKYATLYYHPDEKIVHHIFHQAIGGEEFRSILNAGVDLMQKNEATKWLSDDRLNSKLSDEDTRWSMADWFPRAQKAGWKFWSLVLPHDVMARFNLQEFINVYHEKGLRIMVFTNPDQALEWLKTR